MKYCKIINNVISVVAASDEILVTFSEMIDGIEYFIEKYKQVKDLSPVEMSNNEIYVVTEINSLLTSFNFPNTISFDVVDGIICNVRDVIDNTDILLSDLKTSLLVKIRDDAANRHAELNIIDLQVWRGDSEYTLEDMKLKHKMITDEYHREKSNIEKLTNINDIIEQYQ